ncbi:unnamed protein product [Ascophyllum nodosum]
MTGTIISDQSVTVYSFSEDMNGELYIIDGNNEIYFLPCGDLCGEDVDIPTDDDPVSYTYLGCYADNRDRIFSGNFIQEYAKMTTEFCSAFCQGSAYFGTQYRRECWCGEATDDPKILGSATCTRTCLGDKSQICGGTYAMSVYEYEYITS